MTGAGGAVLAATLGAVVGSFLNVVIWRLPRGESVVHPRSRCPRCGTLIRWFDNLPVVSWALLRARCRTCRLPISVRYPLVEALTGVLFLLAWLEWRPDVVTASLVAVALAALVAVSFIDWDHRIIPDRITKPGMAAAVVLSPLMATHPRGWVASLPDGMGPFVHAAAGLLVGVAVILVIRWLGRLAFRKEAMGLGDAKLLGLIGALTGPLGVLYALLVASLVGSVLGVLLFLVGRTRPKAVVGTAGEHAITSLRFRGERILVAGPPGGTPGRYVRLEATLPAAKVLEDADARVRVGTRLVAVHPGRRDGDAETWELEVVEASEEDRDRLGMFSQSHRYVPFGPFLSLGGAGALLYAERLSWLFTEAYPRWVEGVVGTILSSLPRA